MKYTIKQYAYALSGALEEKAEKQRKEILKKFLLVLRKNSDWAKLDLILKEAEKIYFKKSGQLRVKIESAGEISGGLKKEIKSILGDKVFFIEKINPDILAGLKIFIKDEILIDASGKTRMKKLFNVGR